jgi:hypothetical protein
LKESIPLRTESEIALQKQAVAAKVAVALWRYLPENKRNQWELLASQQKDELIAEAEKKLLEESKAASGGSNEEKPPAAP